MTSAATSRYLSAGVPDQIVGRLEAAKNLKGIVGVMYTNWSSDYSKLKDYADAVNAWLKKNNKK